MLQAEGAIEYSRGAWEMKSVKRSVVNANDDGAVLLCCW